jgi:hypothetical protein
MNNNTTWFQIFVILVAGIVLLVVAAGLLNITNPKIEAKCQAAGGQVLARPGNVSSCLYPAK